MTYYAFRACHIRLPIPLHTIVAYAVLAVVSAEPVIAHVDRLDVMKSE